MDRESAEAALRQVESLRMRTRSDLRVTWFPLTLFGIATLLSAIPVALWGGDALAVYWLVAGLGGGAATAWYYHQHELETGLVDRAFPYVVTAVVLFISAFVLGMIGGMIGNLTLAYAGPPIAIALGYLVFSWLERRLSLAVVSLVLLGVGSYFAIVGVESDSDAILLILISGALMLGTGLAYWRERAAPVAP